MTRINRRAYLMGMGAAAGAVLGAGKLDALAQRGSNVANKCRRPQPSLGFMQTNMLKPPFLWKPRWPSLFPFYPRTQVVTLVFAGLGSLTPVKEGNKTTCEVGFHSAGDNFHYHRLSIQAYDRAHSSARCNLVYDSNRPCEVITKIDLEVEKPLERFPQVFFYEPGDPENRLELEDRRDFRWIIDFESEYLYRYFKPGEEVLPKNPYIYLPTFKVRNGLFYTIRKTASTFRAQPNNGSHVSDLGNVADIMGANVYVKNSTAVTLRVNDKPYRVQAPGEIYFVNHCWRQENLADPCDVNLDHCDAESNNVGDKTKRSDFYLHYKAFELGDKPEFELYLHNSYPPVQVSGLVCHKGRFDPIRLTDEAPCAVSGYGGR